MGGTWKSRCDGGCRRILAEVPAPSPFRCPRRRHHSCPGRQLLAGNLSICPKASPGAPLVAATCGDEILALLGPHPSVLGLSGRSGHPRRVLGMLGVLGIVEDGRRDNKTFASCPMAGLNAGQAGLVAQIRAAGGPSCLPAHWLLGPDLRRILQSRKRPGTPEREPCRQASWHALVDWWTMGDGEGAPLPIGPSWTRPSMDPFSACMPARTLEPTATDAYSVVSRARQEPSWQLIADRLQKTPDNRLHAGGSCAARPIPCVSLGSKPETSLRRLCSPTGRGEGH